MRILIVDDSSAKLAEITSLIQETSKMFQIDTCIDCVSTINLLKEKFDLLIVDLLLPLRANEEPSNQGGKFIIEQISRTNSIKPPTYILGLTQYDELISSFHPFWPAIKYDPTSSIWRENLKHFLIYISRQHHSGDRIIIDKIPSVFVEGKTDEIILLEALSLYFPELKNKIRLKSEIGGGAAWITRQLIVWGFSLPKDSNDEYIKSIGLFDNDSKGEECTDELNRLIGFDTARSECVKTIRYQPKHAKHLIPFYQKGIKLPITLEEMFEAKYWEFASKNNWLENRSNVDSLLKESSRWNKMKQSLSEYIDQLGFSPIDLLYLSRVKNEEKTKFCKYLLALDIEERRVAFKNFKPLLEEIFNLIGIHRSQRISPGQ
jgi:hypothetical protein